MGYKIKISPSEVREVNGTTSPKGPYPLPMHHTNISFGQKDKSLNSFMVLKTLNTWQTEKKNNALKSIHKLIDGQRGLKGTNV